MCIWRRFALFTIAAIASLAIAETQSRRPQDRSGDAPIRGVNLGGWLVAEPWITPSLFESTGDERVIDEWTFGQYVKDAASRLESHWASWITEHDFDDIQAAGLNHVRIPIGYWALNKGDTPFVQGSQYAYLKKAIQWARKRKLKVMVDLHGAVDSQNGYDNSGHRGTLGWFLKEENKAQTVAVLSTFAKDFLEDADTVTSIELLNEPFTVGPQLSALGFTRDYYDKAYSAVRNPHGAGQPRSEYEIVIHDAFQPLSNWSGSFQAPRYESVALDTHIYSVFGPQIAFDDGQRLQFYCDLRDNLTSSNANLPTIVGEWSNAPTDCAKYLNGRGVGARYDGTYPGSTRVGSCAGKDVRETGFSDAYKAFLKQMFDTQRKVYESSGSSGWIFWTWKTEQAAEWDYRAGLTGGWITRSLQDGFPSSAC